MPTTIEVESKLALRMLLLPIRPAQEVSCERALADTLRELGISAADYAAWVRVAIGNWEDACDVSEDLKLLVRNVMKEADSQFGSLLAAKFFDLHSKLQSQYLLSHSEARAFLSHGLLVADLAKDDRLSAAQISRILHQRDMRVPFSRQSIGSFLQALGLQRKLNECDVKDLFANDMLAELPVLADADLEVAADIVSQFGDPLGFPAALLAQSLQTLAQTSKPSAFGPYVQILHYQCIIAEFFDHAVTDLYEFQPRGNLPKWVFSHYPTNSMGVSGNPFLNNAKSVEQISPAWVRSKGPGELRGADSLYKILAGLDAMGFAARRELARMIRLWALRAIRISKPLATILPQTLTDTQASNILELVARGNTSSFGVIEQRVVDALAICKHQADEWRPRGLKDAVNATNISRRKLGDCDFQNSSLRKIDAYESHGGKLTDAYVQDHLRTVRKSMALRIDELSSIADPSEWSVTITFVAHDVATTSMPNETILGVQFSCEAISFRDFIASSPAPDALLPTLNEYFLEPMGQRATPLEVRALVLELL